MLNSCIGHLLRLYPRLESSLIQGIDAMQYGEVRPADYTPWSTIDLIRKKKHVFISHINFLVLRSVDLIFLFQLDIKNH